MPETDKYKKKSPGYTMVGRYETRSKDVIPGPGAHSYDNVTHVASLYMHKSGSQAYNWRAIPQRRD